MRERRARSSFALGVVMVTLAATAPSAFARAAGAPRQPTALTVDGMTAPLGVDPDLPAFAWHVADLRRGARQSAYRIVVARRPTIKADDHDVVWDSGEVASAEQAFVTYTGPRLAADTAYWWTVRTRDAAGVESPFARPTRFATGLRDADWKAMWLRPGPASPGPDEYTYVRKEARLARSPITRAIAYVAAAHQYELWIDGRRVDKGPSFAYPDFQYSQASDVTRDLRAGASNTIGVLHHWYGPGQGRPASLPGLIVHLDVTHRDGSHELVVTDASWREHPAEWTQGPPRNDEGDFVEHLDGRAAPHAWSRSGFDGRAWTPVAVLGAHPAPPFTHLVGQRTRVVEHVARPRSVRHLADGAYVADYGAVIAAVPAVTFHHGRSGRPIAMHAGYLLDPDGHVSTTHGTQATDMGYGYVERAGPQVFRPFGYLGFRYFEVDAPGEQLTRTDLTAYARHAAMPAEQAATFHSSDPTLDAVWELGRHSALYGSQEQFVDTPTREKGQFLADAADISQTTMRAFGEQNLTSQALADFARSQARYWPDGRVNAIDPVGGGKRDIPDYTELYPEWVWRYYESTGDRATLARVYPVLVNIANYVARSEDPASGLVTRLPGGGEDYAFGIVDWPPAMRYGYDVATAARTTVNVLAVDTFRKVAETAHALRRDDEGEGWEQRAQALAAEINVRLTRPDGVYVDGLEPDGAPSLHPSQQANAEALAYGVVPPGRIATVASYTASLDIAMGPMNGLALLRALHAGGRDADLVRILTARDHPGWAHILASGGTYTWETWTPSDTEGDSMSHAWGSTVLVGIQEALLGVTPIDPSFDVFEVRLPAGGLSRASGRVPTVAGPIEVVWSRSRRGRVTIHVTVPPNTHAVVDVPTDSVARVTVDGRSVITAPDGRPVVFDGTAARIGVDAGTYTLVGPG